MNKSIYNMTLASMLCALGILIPMISPIKVVIEPASFTLASHVAIMIAMFLSPPIAIFVTLGTTLGFLLAGFPITIVARAFSHLIFISIGAIIIQKRPSILQNPKAFFPFALFLSIIHAVCEVLIVIPFLFGTPALNDIFYMLFLLIGVGTIVHSMIDFTIAYGLFKILKLKTLQSSTQK